MSITGLANDCQPEISGLDSELDRRLWPRARVFRTRRVFSKSNSGRSSIDGVVRGGETEGVRGVEEVTKEAVLGLEPSKPGRPILVGLRHRSNRSIRASASLSTSGEPKSATRTNGEGASDKGEEASVESEPVSAGETSSCRRGGL